MKFTQKRQAVKKKGQWWKRLWLQVLQGKMRTKPNKQELQPQEENDLRVENQRLRAEVAYLKKLRVLVEERIVRENGNGQKPSKN